MSPPDGLFSLLRCSACALFSYVLSVILTKERSLPASGAMSLMSTSQLLPSAKVTSATKKMRLWALVERYGLVRYVMRITWLYPPPNSDEAAPAEFNCVRIDVCPANPVRSNRLPAVVIQSGAFQNVGMFESCPNKVCWG